MGYGDITPVAPLAQSFAYAEAVIGVLYVAVLVARLVSAFTDGSPASRIGPAGGELRERPPRPLQMRGASRGLLPVHRFSPVISDLNVYINRNPSGRS